MEAVGGELCGKGWSGLESELKDLYRRRRYQVARCCYFCLGMAGDFRLEGVGVGEEESLRKQTSVPALKQSSRRDRGTV